MRALQDCKDVTKESFPLLDANKTGNPPKSIASIVKLNSMPQAKIMLFVVRLHYAIHVMTQLDKRYVKKFDFECFPELKVVLKLVEKELKRIMMGGKNRKFGKASGGGSEGGLENILSKIANLENQTQAILKTAAQKASMSIQSELKKIKNDVQELLNSNEMMIKGVMASAVSATVEKKVKETVDNKMDVMAAQLAQMQKWMEKEMQNKKEE
jgi:hypothetical protein